ncbi:MAG: rhodanese-like domain-containing protein [Leptospirillia bacterium]
MDILIGLASGLLAVAALWFGPGLVAALFGVRGMTPKGLRRHLTRGVELVVLDVRTDPEFAAGHIKGAKHLPLDKVKNGLPLLAGMKDTPVVCVCASGLRSAFAAIRLRRAGFPRVYNMAGGMLLWGRKDISHD